MISVSILKIEPDNESDFPVIDDEYDNYSSFEERPDYQKDYYTQEELEECPSQIIEPMEFDDDTGG